MAHTLDDLFGGVPGARIDGDPRAVVRGLCTDSRRVTPGAVFFAISGRRTNGRFYIEEAVQRGAAAVVSEERVWVPRKTTLVVVPEIRGALVEVARRYYSMAQEKLALTGVAGSGGKTVVATLVREFLNTMEEPVGLLGTIHYAIGKRTLPAYRTTPEPVDLYALFSQMAEAGCRQAVMEVSSHGIDQARVKGLGFDVAVFTGLFPEHLDYHGSMENYFATLRRIFDGENGPTPRVAVINTDDEWGRRLHGELAGRCEVVSVGTAEGADLRAEEIDCATDGTRFRLVGGGHDIRVFSPLLGDFNVTNLLCALAVVRVRGGSLTEALGKLIDFDGVRGRIERVELGQPYSVIVDYAHTESSYAKTLDMLRRLAKSRVITVFGCGGDRDRSRRPRIARIVADRSDLAFATTDNPRSETVDGIFADMRGGLRADDGVRFVDDRRHAISLALDAAGPGDIVLIAGKGHETFQEYTDSVVPFDDRAVARELISKKMGTEL
ncbi:MAG: UDP-N-acetylmuramoyl-L-alanyl-D-glutamate--2,6-diaminopimelate ligase [Opitutales bacterium]|nr:UDP-N-acetylmuramoyl-L-alanyl-D-glutamate--2,6-diaminopimelate ligase [Opitutales bacterium]